MSLSTPPDCESKPTSTLPEEPGVLVVRKHHFLVRWSHWLNVPILLGLILSGISIYWASPIYQHKPDPNRGNTDVVSMTMLQRRFTLKLGECPPTPNRRLPLSGTTTMELLLMPAIFLDGD